MPAEGSKIEWTQDMPAEGSKTESTKVIISPLLFRNPHSSGERWERGQF
jgi:hypothetical protein